MTTTLTPGQLAHRRYMASVEWEATKRWYRLGTPPKRRCCRVCGVRQGLDTHHRDYRQAYRAHPYRAIGRERRRHLAFLCRRHHDALHDFARRRHLSVRTASRWFLGAAWVRRHGALLIVGAVILLLVI